MIFKEFRIDNVVYDEVFFSIIDNLIELKFGKEIAELICFYVYERFNPDGTTNSLMDAAGNPVVLNNAEDLWDLIVLANPTLGNS
jgi:hypothetical protein